MLVQCWQHLVEFFGVYVVSILTLFAYAEIWLMLKCCERKTLFHSWKVFLDKFKRTGAIVSVLWSLVFDSQILQLHHVRLFFLYWLLWINFALLMLFCVFSFLFCYCTHVLYLHIRIILLKQSPCSLMLKFGLCWCLCWNVMRGKHCSMTEK